jgi:hypothetical protein
LFPKRELPLVSISLVNAQEAWFDSGKDGLGSLAALMLSEGAGDLDSLAFEKKLQSLGATFTATCGAESAVASFTTLKRTFNDSVPLFAAAVRSPRNGEADWNRVRSIRLDELAQEASQPGAVAQRVAHRIYFGDASPYGHIASGTVASVNKITLDEVKAVQQAMFNPAASTFLIAGDLTAEEAKSALDKAFAGWKPASGSFAKAPTSLASPSAGLRIAIVDRPGATQTTIRFITPGVKFADSSRVHRTLLNTILGGSFTSRLNQNLREDHGYTYGARSGFEMNLHDGAFTAGAAVKAEVTGASLAEFIKEFNRIASGDITQAETAKARETERNNAISAFEGLRGITSTTATFVLNGMPIDTTASDLEAMQRAAAADLNSLAKKAVSIDKGVLVLVGDKKLITDQLAGLNLGTPVEYTPEGLPKPEGVPK